MTWREGTLQASGSENLRDFQTPPLHARKAILHGVDNVPVQLEEVLSPATTIDVAPYGVLWCFTTADP